MKLLFVLGFEDLYHLERARVKEWLRGGGVVSRGFHAFDVLCKQASRTEYRNEGKLFCKSVFRITGNGGKTSDLETEKYLSSLIYIGRASLLVRTINELP